MPGTLRTKSTSGKTKLPGNSGMRNHTPIVLLFSVIMLSPPAAQSQDGKPDGLRFSEARKIVRQVMAEYSPLVESDRTEVRFAGETCVIHYSATQFSLTQSSFGLYKASVLAKGTSCPLHDWYQVRLCLENQVVSCERLYDAFIYLQKRKNLGGGGGEANVVFSEAAANYRAADPKPSFPEAARRFRIQAEASVQEKEFEDAADLYAEALKIAPWWPEGRFNRALILGELKEHAEAMVEMKRYLALVPDAPNARAAQDKIYEWEGKAGSGK